MSEVKPVASIIAHYQGNEYAVAFEGAPEMDRRLYSQSQVTALLARAEAAEKLLDSARSLIAAHSNINTKLESELSALKDDYKAVLQMRQELEDARIADGFAASELREELSALRESVRWIPVSERLPEADKPVLVWVENPTVKPYFADAIYFEGRWLAWCDAEDGYGSSIGNDNVKAWKPVAPPESVK